MTTSTNLTDSTAYGQEWLALRERADGAARATGLVETLREFLLQNGFVVRDLGCGSGGLGRWLAGRLPGAQRWVLHDRDAELLTRARDGLPRASLDGRPVTGVAELGDVTELTATGLEGTALVCGSALLDLLTEEELRAVAEAAVAAGCAVYFTLSVLGRVELTPAEPLDGDVAEAFDAHQRRAARGGRLLGPDAVPAAVSVFERLGASVTCADSPWRLGPDDAALTASWLAGWVDAACEQRPELAPAAGGYRKRRLRAIAADGLRAVVHHRDVLALPGTR